jgi:hypothetical protein
MNSIATRLPASNKNKKKEEGEKIRKKKKGEKIRKKKKEKKRTTMGREGRERVGKKVK